MRVVRFNQFADLAPHRAAWDRLAGDNPFRTWNWCEAWWRHFSPLRFTRHANELYIVAALDDGGELAAVLPAWLRRSNRRGRILELLGGDEVCSDYRGLLCRADVRHETASAIAQWLTRCGVRGVRGDRWDVLLLEGASPDDEATRRLLDELRALDNDVLPRHSYNCWRLDLTGGWERCLERLSKGHRKQIRRLNRQLADGTAVVRWAEDTASYDQAFDTLVELHQKRRNSLGEGGCFALEAFDGFHRETAAELFAAGRLRMAWLEIGGLPVAAEYQFTGGDVTFAYQSGIEPAALHLEPGRLITVATIRRAIDDGQTAIDFLRGDEPYKAHLRAERGPMYDVRVVPNRASARLRNCVYTTARQAKRWVKRRLGLPIYEPAAPLTDDGHVPASDSSHSPATAPQLAEANV